MIDQQIQTFILIEAKGACFPKAVAPAMFPEGRSALKQKITVLMGLMIAVKLCLFLGFSRFLYPETYIPRAKEALTLTSPPRAVFT